MKRIILGDYIDVLTDYHSGGSYKTLKEHTKILHEPNYAVMVRTINFENDNFQSDLIYCDEDSYNFLEYCHVFENDIFMNKIANAGSVYIMPKVPYKATCAMNLFLLRFKNINQRYIFYVMKNSESYIKSQAHGTTTKTITKDEVRNLSFLIHDTEGEQNVVESILTSIDAKIALNKSICSDLEAMAKLIYDYWFVQFDFPDENGKPYKSSGGKMVWNEELKREIPEGWEVKPLSYSIANINTGLNPRDNFVLNTGGTNRYVTTKNIQLDGKIDFNGCDLIDDNAMRIVHKRSDIAVGDILMASILPLGRCCVIMSEPVDWDINESVFAIRPNYKVCSYGYLYMTLMSDYFIKTIENSSVGSIFKGIRIEVLNSTMHILPDKTVLDKFESTINYILLKREQASTENEDLTKLRDFLLPMLMNGQVKVGNPSA